MGKLGYAKKGKAPVTSLMVVDATGTAERLGGFMTAATIAFNNLTPATITDSGSGFLSKMLKAGMRIEVSGSGSNDGKYTIASVVAGTITLIAGDVLADEVAGATVTISCLDKIFCKKVNIQALEGNTANIAFGDDNALVSSGQGMILSPLSETYREGVYLSDIYVDVGVNGEGVSVAYEEVL